MDIQPERKPEEGEKYSAYYIADRGMMLSTETGDTIKTPRGVASRLRKMGFKKQDNSFQVDGRTIQEWNDYVRERIEWELYLYDLDLEEFKEDRIKGYQKKELD